MSSNPIKAINASCYKNINNNKKNTAMLIEIEKRPDQFCSLQRILKVMYAFS